MKIRVVVVGLALVVGGLAGGRALIVNQNTTPMVQQIVSAGYPLKDLSEPVCSGQKCKDGTIEMTNKDIREVVYKPANAPNGCRYRLYRTSAGVTHKSSWEFRFYIDAVDGITPHLESSSSHIGGKGNGWAKDKSGRSSVAIAAPTPKQLWTFALEHVESPDPRCKPVGA